ncbi:hypothetical protein LX32DRAFT_346034 [Colletotrichum zoysiae]|uniref:Uncharacterized protein n=1 Tax=Colletotrichum zoysiae TaxID=1216348 RepID=A0AAD9M2R3_9PEZI|nr:hypothetical protein LX32DRAFT_346034 [Colletotrichum zoysiae]
MTATFNTTSPSCLIAIHFCPFRASTCPQTCLPVAKATCLSVYISSMKILDNELMTFEIEHAILSGITRPRRHFNTAYAPRMQSCLVRIWGSVAREGSQLEVGLSNTPTHKLPLFPHIVTLSSLSLKTDDNAGWPPRMQLQARRSSKNSGLFSSLLFRGCPHL